MGIRDSAKQPKPLQINREANTYLNQDVFSPIAHMLMSMCEVWIYVSMCVRMIV